MLDINTQASCADILTHPRFAGGSPGETVSDLSILDGALRLLANGLADRLASAPPALPPEDLAHWRTEVDAARACLVRTDAATAEGIAARRSFAATMAAFRKALADAGFAA